MAANQARKVTIKIPRPLYEKIGRLIEDSGYNSVTDFICYVLRDIIGSHGGVNGGPYSEEELAQVKQHLHRLGYL